MHGPYERVRAGRTVLEGRYEQGARAGTWQSFSATGQPVEVQHYDADLKTGVWRTWSPDGVLLSEVSYDQGRRHGPEQHWYPSGSPKERGGNLEGRREGIWTAWHEGGKRRWERNFDLGERDGAWSEWAEDGRLLVRGTYVQGERHGIWEEWYPSGTPRLRITYEKGLASGEPQYWSPLGAPIPALQGGILAPVIAGTRLLGEERPPDPRLTWALRPPAQPGPPVEVGEMVVFAAGQHVYGVRADDPALGWGADIGEPLSDVPAVVDGEVLLWTSAGQLVVVGPIRPLGPWAMHRLDADLSVAPAISDPYVLFVGRDNRLRAYDRRAGALVWSREIEGEALEIGLAPERAWVLTTAGELQIHELNGEGVQTVTLHGTEGGPRWTSRPWQRYLLYWWSGRTLEAVRPLDGGLAWTWDAPPGVHPEETRLVQVASPHGDLAIVQGYRRFVVDTARSGEVSAEQENAVASLPADYSVCRSWGRICAQADRSGGILYPGGRPYLGVALAGPPDLGEHSLWVSTDAGWVGRLDFAPHLDVSLAALDAADQGRLELEGHSAEEGSREVRWSRAQPFWERVAMDLTGAPIGDDLRVAVTLRTGDIDQGPPLWATGWSVESVEHYQEAVYRYRLFREIGSYDFPDADAERLEEVMTCQHRDRIEAAGRLVLTGRLGPTEPTHFDRSLRGTFRLSSEMMAKACAVLISHKDPRTGAFVRLGAFGAPGRPLATTQKLRLELMGVDDPMAVGTLVAPEPPEHLLDSERVRIVQDSGFGPQHTYEVAAPTDLGVDPGVWVLRGASGQARVEVPSLALDRSSHSDRGLTYEVTSWHLRRAALGERDQRVIPVFDRSALAASEPELTP